MGLAELAQRISAISNKSIGSEATFELGDCSAQNANAIWSKYVNYRRAGYVKPFWARRTPHKIKLFHMGSHIVKEYTGAREAVEKEVAILRQVHHENLVGYLFVADQGSKISIVMEWAGDSLREHRTVTQPKQYCEAVVRHMLYQLTHAVVYLHQKGIIHRDIKPDNIGVHVDHKVQLFDWGEAISLDQVNAASGRELARQVGLAGTPLFMPPEALNYLTDRDRDPKGEHHLRSILTTKLDVWGLGTVLFFLLAGRDIFVNDSSWELDALADIANASCGVELPLGVTASHAARDFLRRCLERDPCERASAKELMQHPWLMGASSYSDMQAFHAAQARVHSYQSSVQRTALLSVLAESFSSEDDDNCSLVNQPISLDPVTAAAAAERAAAAIAAAQGADDNLAASLALASGVTDLVLEQQVQLPIQPQQQQPMQQLGCEVEWQQQQQRQVAQHRHHRSSSFGGSYKSLQATEEVAAAAAKELQQRAAAEAVCEVRLKLSQSGALLPSAGSVPHMQTVF
eukprot:GHRQ01000992.1.p1 GENE.GHRQ01000992.1~~GHRQ01000992.1.p1  ORF type:complete len:517 (+),score=232.21 GHRQ01000992.1:150-1700(+)